VGATSGEGGIFAGAGGAISGAVSNGGGLFGGGAGGAVASAFKNGGVGGVIIEYIIA
jgi:hypothetical protein